MKLSYSIFLAGTALLILISTLQVNAAGFGPLRQNLKLAASKKKGAV
jgi:hypothetical protein